MVRWALALASHPTNGRDYVGADGSEESVTGKDLLKGSQVIKVV